MNNAQRILVTGGAGFIGSHTVEKLLALGREVRVLDNLSSGKLENLDLSHPAIEFIEGDVLEYPYLEDLVRDCDAVLHLAAIVSVPLSIENPIYSFQVNTQGFLHVLQAVHRSGRRVRVVQASSAAVYGNASDLPCRDDMPLSAQALSPYALQKIHSEDYAKLYGELHGVKSLALRYFNIYGQGQHPGSPYSGVISRFLDAYQKNEELTIFGDGQQTRDFIHVSDVARANCLALESDYCGVLNIATGQPQTLLQMIDYMSSAGERPAKLNFLPERKGDIRASYAAVEMAEKHLAFKYSLPQEQGMRLMLGV
jgi:nucleoside-diphosphate-sugar epimerase